MADSNQATQPTQAIDALKLFNEFQAQSRARMEAGLKLLLVVSGTMLTLSVGAVLGNPGHQIPRSLLSLLVWAWDLLFFSIAGSILLMASMIGATFHMGMRWRRAFEDRNAGTRFIATWTWLRILNVTIGASVLLSFLIGVYLVADVAIGMARAATTGAPPAVSTPADVHAVESSPAPSPNATGTTRSGQDEKAALDRKLVDYNGDLAHYTLALAILAGLQFIALFLQVIFLRLAFREARRAGDIARDAMIAGERAFVFAMGLNQYWNLDEQTGQYVWRFRPIWKNSGDTPTRNMTMYTECVVRDSVIPKGFDFEYPVPEFGTALIPPNAELSGGIGPWPSQPAITPKDIVDSQQGKKWIYILGWARYHDVFAGSPQHITRFCWLITPLGDPTKFNPDGTGKLTFPTLHHGEGNCADDECNV